eukprot:GILI01018055.1.p1 GENE.GILI01018055.1~~GILI01018055.1.p1  ORF type:complete len:419 (+),score=70.69 GILI01018055.1:59-1315(+)
MVDFVPVTGLPAQLAAAARSVPVELSPIVDAVVSNGHYITIFIALSLLGYRACLIFIPKVMEVLFNRGIYGIDINKNTKEQMEKYGEMRRAGGGDHEVALKKAAVPESLGIVVGGLYLCVVGLILLCQGAIVSVTNDAEKAVPLAKANAAINSIAVMLLLGFVDDVLDVRWKYKIILSLVGVISLLLAYDGPLSVAVPHHLREYLNGASLLYLGPLYLAYMALFCVFCTNSINILAGINGVEVGQSLVIAVASIVHNIIQLRQPEVATQHLLCLSLLLPFVGVSFALWKFNKYPSKVFVGDSYTYFAGMTLAVAGITGSYTKTLMLFFIPQLINFVLSLPQLFHLIPCPRHRVPKWDPKRDVLVNSKNYTILNAILLITGDLHEKRLTQVTILFQVVCCLLGFLVRYGVAAWFYENVS